MVSSTVLILLANLLKKYFVQFLDYNSLARVLVITHLNFVTRTEYSNSLFRYDLEDLRRSVHHSYVV